ncbi:MAG: hypothetical protein KDA73_15220 [Rhodobacteraceae bacterium]|nr:hypothetical protein [Paracoccaceae bacterium]
MTVPTTALIRSGPLLAAATFFAGTALAQEPGQFDVDPEAAERALERALVQTGSILLPAGAAEVAPYFSFQRNESEVAGVPVLVGNQLVGTTIATDQNQATAGVILRAGLPWAAQLDLNLPFTYQENSTEQRVLGASLTNDSQDSTGIGDVVLTYTQSLTGNDPDRPAFLASVSYDSDTGDRENGLYLGTGFQEVELALTATTRQDPLVFSVRVAYQHGFENNHIQPGDQYSLAAGAFLAVNPQTSLQFGFTVAYTDDYQYQGRTVSGSDQFAASLNLGIATILRRNTLLDMAINVGLTEDAPDFAFVVSLPIRFNFR